MTGSIYLMMVRDGVTFLCGIPGIQRTGTSLWWVPMTGSIYRRFIIVTSHRKSAHCLHESMF
ncbi:unnamed protein product [Staurois parvus]|uniref:Uncharacterized protein n=1 Tax=Staurois parvus TaxID=386267 RepID=A0ABN9ANB2_9NEOB|nr:unnamed protein product [Staurois parvus]